MGFGGPIGLIVVGLILALAFNDQQVGPLEVILSLIHISEPTRPY